MKEFTIVGRPNSGKTLLALNFALYLGCKNADITFRAWDGYLNCRHFSVVDAIKELCSSDAHKTRLVQSLILQIPVGKSSVKFKLNDTCGVTESIHGNEQIRRGMAQTLSLLRGSDYIIHVLDLAAIGGNDLMEEGNIDHEIYRYGTARNRYMLLGNKIDLPAAQNNLAKCTAFFTQARLFPVSALNKQGFQEVKRYVAGNI